MSGLGGVLVCLLGSLQVKEAAAWPVETSCGQVYSTSRLKYVTELIYRVDGDLYCIYWILPVSLLAWVVLIPRKA